MRRMSVDDSESEFNAITRLELTKLQRQYRISEGAKRVYAEETGTTISRQHRNITLLRNQKEDLDVDMSNANSLPKRMKDENIRKKVVQMLNDFDQYQTNISSNIGMIAETEHHVDRITQQVVNQQLRMTSLYGSAMTVPESDKKLLILENRLYHRTTMFDTLVSKNHVLRNDINMLLMERGRFHKRYVFIRRRVAIIKSEMLEVVDLATQTYDQRDEAVTKIKNLRERDAKESRQHAIDIKEYKRILHNDEKSHTYMEAKVAPRPLIEDNTGRILRLESDKEVVIDDILLRYKKSFKEIREISEIHDVETLCQTYKGRDQTNFGQFKYISDVNNEVEVLRESIRLIKDEIEDLAVKEHESQRHNQNALLKRETEVSNSKQCATEARKERDTAEESIDELLKHIDDSFNFTHCRDEPIMKLLGNTQGIDSRNVCLFLEVLEHKINELITKKAILEIRRHAELEGGQALPKQVMLPVIKPKSQGGPFKPKVIMTGRLEAGDDDEEEDKIMSAGPLYYQAFKASITEKLRNTGVILKADEFAAGMVKETDQPSMAESLTEMPHQTAGATKKDAENDSRTSPSSDSRTTDAESEITDSDQENNINPTVDSDFEEENEV